MSRILIVNNGNVNNFPVSLKNISIIDESNTEIIFREIMINMLSDCYDLYKTGLLISIANPLIIINDDLIFSNNKKITINVINKTIKRFINTPIISICRDDHDLSYYLINLEKVNEIQSYSLEELI